MTMTVHPTRAVVLSATTGASGWLLADQAAAQAALPPTLESLVTAGVLLGGAVAALGVALLSLGAIVEGLLGWRPRAAGALPAPLHRFLTGSVAAAIVVGAALPASAEEVYPGWAPAVPVASASPTAGPASPTPSPSPTEEIAASTSPAPHPPSDPDPVIELHAESAAGPLEGGATSGATAAHTDASAPSTSLSQRGTVHVVSRGESLWRIARELLGPDASNEQIARAWPVIYRANLNTIGDDPGLILPGQRLTIPQDVAR